MSKKRGRDFVGEERHYAVRKARGRASEYVCTDCPERAKEWSHIHGTEGDLPEHYEPRCRSCHARYDHHLRWGKPGYRESISAAVKESWKDGTRAAPESLSGEHKEKISQSMKEFCQDPVNQQSRSDRMKAWHASPEGQAFRQKRREFYAARKDRDSVEKGGAR